MIDTRHYLLVSDIDAQNEPWYYAGYYLKVVKNNKTFCVPANAAQRSKALKIAYKEEAYALCKEINKQPHFTYRVVEEARL